jgi:hypothetical protein
MLKKLIKRLSKQSDKDSKEAATQLEIMSQALLQITQIKNEDSGDWDEIDNARNIAKNAIDSCLEKSPRLKDHEKAQLTNELTTAIQPITKHPSLRDRISRVVNEFFKE